jgi:hypothetical protein
MKGHKMSFSRPKFETKAAYKKLLGKVNCDTAKPNYRA